MLQCSYSFFCFVFLFGVADEFWVRARCRLHRAALFQLAHRNQECVTAATGRRTPQIYSSTTAVLAAHARNAWYIHTRAMCQLPPTMDTHKEVLRYQLLELFPALDLASTMSHGVSK